MVLRLFTSWEATQIILTTTLKYNSLNEIDYTLLTNGKIDDKSSETVV